MKLSELCVAINVSDSTMSNWKKRETDPPAKYIIPICKFLKVSPYRLLTGKEKPEFDEDISLCNQSPTIMSNLLTLLEEKNIKPSELCTELKISDSTFSTWKKRMTDPPARYILPICEFLGISYYELLGEMKKTIPTESVTIGNQSPTITNDESELGIQKSTKVLMKEVTKIFDKLQPRQQVRLMNLIYDYEEKCRSEQTDDDE